MSISHTLDNQWARTSELMLAFDIVAYQDK